MKKIFETKKRSLTVIVSLIVVVAVGLVIMPRLYGASDCTLVERYDVLRDECYFECDSDQQCQALSKQVDSELDAALKVSTTKAATQKPTAPEQPSASDLYTLESTGSETKGTVYTVRDGKLLPIPKQSNEQLWQLFNALIGSANVQKHIVSFEVFNDQNNDTAASVWRTQNNAEQWHMNINAAFATQDKKDLIRTVIHEYGHVVTLSGNQVPVVTGACPRIQLDEGCGNSGSYINSFYTKFWNDYGFAADQVGSISENDAADLYASEPNSFVSQYASTNISEDIAESFADFVTKSKPSGTAIKDQKVRFFCQYPELVSMREQIRAAAAKVIL